LGEAAFLATLAFLGAAFLGEAFLETIATFLGEAAFFAAAF